MQLPERFSDLPEYAFPRLRRLLGGVPPGAEPLAMSIGEPQHGVPELVARVVMAHAEDFGRYPPNEGTPVLLEAVGDWVARRYGVRIDPDRQVIALNGTREGLFNAALALSPETKGGGRPAVLMPNPFYQCYGAAARACGAEPVEVPATAETGFLPDYGALDPAILARTTLVYLCSPSNPQGAVASGDYWRNLLALADRYDFRILSDECYSEIYPAAPPMGGLEAVAGAGADPERVVVFHSLSKRSSVPGLRSGFAAGGAQAIAAMRTLRAYGGAPLPLPLQHAAAALWRDEAHVAENRALYAAKFALAERILGGLSGYSAPGGGFFLWLRVGDGERATLDLWRTAGVRVLPGAYLARDDARGRNPGRDYIRVALVADAASVERGLAAIRDVLGAEMAMAKG